jgi:signal transduction histidine kinase
LLIGGAVVFHLWQLEETRTETLMRETASALRVALDEQLEGLEAQLATVSRFAMRGGDPSSFPERIADLVRRDREVAYGWVAVFDGSGKTLAKVPEAAETSRGEAAVKEALASQKTSVSDIFTSAFLGGAAVAVSLPVPERSDQRFLVQMAVPISRFAEILKDLEMPPEWGAVVADGEGARVTATPGAAKLVEAKSDIVVIAESRISRWKVGVGMPRALAEAPLRRTMGELAAAGALLILAGTLISFRLHRSIVRSINCLSRVATALGAGEPPVAPVAGFREVAEIALSLEQVAIRLKSTEQERDRALRTVQAANETLEHRVRERTTGLAAANRRLSEEMQRRVQAEEELRQKSRVEAIGQLTAAVAHDFNNLLTPIIGNLELLRTRLAEEKSIGMAQNALHAAERAARLIAQLLAFGGRQQLSTVVLNLNALIRRVEPLLADAAGPVVMVALRLAQDDWAVRADPVQLELALLNLVMNARDAMPNGGTVLVRTEWLAAAGNLSGLPPGDWATIAVTDEGVGMEPAVAAHAMEPFFTTKQQGRGLGLSAVQGLVRQLGGECSISSKPNKGTTVRLYLPRAELDASPDDQWPHADFGAAADSARSEKFGHRSTTPSRKQVSG